MAVYGKEINQHSHSLKMCFRCAQHKCALHLLAIGIVLKQILACDTKDARKIKTKWANYYDGKIVLISFLCTKQKAKNAAIQNYLDRSWTGAVILLCITVIILSVNELLLNFLCRMKGVQTVKLIQQCSTRGERIDVPLNNSVFDCEIFSDKGNRLITSNCLNQMFEF